MTEQVPNGAPAPGMTQVRMQILAQVVRDLSFENAVALKGIQATDVQPEMALAVNLDARKRPVENQYDVIIKLKVTATNKADKATLYILEIEYGGSSISRGFPKNSFTPSC
jgi:protein translocase subunit secB